MEPKSLNSLMAHLRESGVSIGGSSQKRKLKNIGHYHGYKGFRFATHSGNRLPIRSFDQIVLLHSMDMQIKTLLYPQIMFIETALKNYTLEAVLADARSSSFDAVYKRSLVANRGYQPGSSKYKGAWTERLRLKQSIDGLIARGHDTKPFFKHFRDKDEDIPLWAVFEGLTLGEFGAFYGCLSRDVKSSIIGDLGMPTNCDAESLLLSIIYALKDLRNSIAHNAIVVDVRFKTGKVSAGIGRLLKSQAEIDYVNFADITDYVILVVYLLSLMGVSKTERKRVLADYESILDRYKLELPPAIFGALVRTETAKKLKQVRFFVTRN